MLSIVIRDLLCNIVQSLPARRARPNLTKIDSMEVRTLLAAGLGPSSTTTPTIYITRLMRQMRRKSRVLEHPSGKT